MKHIEAAALTGEFEPQSGTTIQALADMIGMGGPSAGERYAKREGKEVYDQQRALADEAMRRGLGSKQAAGQAQLRQGLGMALQQQQASANSATGGGMNQALAQRAAANAGSQMQTRVNQQAAVMAAQEQTANMGLGMAGQQQTMGMGLGLAGVKDQARAQRSAALGQTIGGVAGAMTGTGAMGMLG